MASADPTKFLLQSVPVFIAYIDDEERYRYMNANYGDLYGEDHGLIDQPARDVIGEEAYARVKPYLEKAFRGERTSYQHWLTLAGRRRFFRTYYIPHVVEGKVRGLAVCGIDATEEQLAKEGLEASEAQFRGVFENATAGIVLSSTEGTIIAANQYTCDLFGYSQAELVGMNARHLRHPDDPVAGEEVMRRVLAGEVERAEVENRFLTRDGDVIWLRTSFSLIETGKGGEPFFLGVLTDVTPHKRAEDALQSLNTELESKVAERTAELTELNSELDSFNHTVSHDLRAPLRTLSGFTRVLLEDYGDALDDTAKDYINRISAAATNVSDLIDGLLVLSNYSRQELKRSKVDLSRIAERAIEGLREEDPQRKVTVKIQPGMQVEGDERLLEVLLYNLLSNAWKYTGYERRPRIEVSSEKADGATLVCVHDNGAGFDQSYVEQAFAPFQRLHPTGEFEGRGIGLATVKRIVRRHGGRIWAESEPGKGSTFMFTLPD